MYKNDKKIQGGVEVWFQKMMPYKMILSLLFLCSVLCCDIRVSYATSITPIQTGTTNEGVEYEIINNGSKPYKPYELRLKLPDGKVRLDKQFFTDMGIMEDRTVYSLVIEGQGTAIIGDLYIPLFVEILDCQVPVEAISGKNERMVETGSGLLYCNAQLREIKNFKIADGVTETSKWFQNFRNLECIPENFTLPDSVENAEFMFSQCRKLEMVKNLQLSKNLKNTKCMFEICMNLKKVEMQLPDGLENAEKMFSFCGELTELTGLQLPKGLTNASGMFKGCNKLTIINELALPDGLTNASEMFADCSELTTVNELVLPKSLINASGMFAGCSQLIDKNRLVLPKGLTNVSRMFERCYQLTEIKPLFGKENTVRIPSTIVDASYMFSRCNNINMPNTLEIGAKNIEGLFASWIEQERNLPDQLTIQSSVEKASNMFNNCVVAVTSNTHIIIEPNAGNMCDMFDGCTLQGNLGEVKIGEGVMVSGNYWGNKTLFRNQSGIIGIDKLIIEKNVQNIKYLFSECTNLKCIKQLEMPDDIVNISGMFYKCTNLTSLPENFTMGEQVTEASRMFYGCTSLKNLPESFMMGKQVTDAWDMFRCCTSLENLPENFRIGQSVESQCIFWECDKLKKLPEGTKWDSAIVSKYDYINGLMYYHMLAEIEGLPQNFTIQRPEWNKIDGYFSKCTNLKELPEGFELEGLTEDNKEEYPLLFTDPFALDDDSIEKRTIALPLKVHPSLEVYTKKDDVDAIFTQRFCFQGLPEELEMNGDSLPIPLGTELSEEQTIIDKIDEIEQEMKEKGYVNI